MPADPTAPRPIEPNLLAYLESYGWSLDRAARWRHPDVPGDVTADRAYELCMTWECLARDDFDGPADGDPRVDPNDVNTRGLPTSHRP